MHDFHCTDAKDIHSAILARRVHELKETQEGVEIMCREMDAIYREGEMRGEMRGELRGEKRGEERGRIEGRR
jgi:predicted transposase YdaD